LVIPAIDRGRFRLQAQVAHLGIDEPMVAIEIVEDAVTALEIAVGDISGFAADLVGVVVSPLLIIPTDWTRPLTIHFHGSKIPP
jgi:hypothetical protein